jgi:hypothetical protein
LAIKGFCGVLLVFVLSSCATPHSNSESEVQKGTDLDFGVSEFWPSTPGLALRFEGARTKNGQDAATEHVVFRCGEPIEFDGEMVEVQHVRTEVVSADGTTSSGSLNVLQHVDRDSTFTRAVQFPDGDPITVKRPMIDLTAPLDRGNSWVSRQAGRFPDLGVDEQVVVTYSSTIVATDESVEAADQMATGCLKVIETGISVDNHMAECSDGRTVECKILVDRTRWWCRALGSVRELTVFAAVTADDEDACSEARSTYSLAEISYE